MKILLLNPHIDASHKVIRELESRGHALLLAANHIEASQLLKLHGRSVELAIIHREGIDPATRTPGINFVTMFRQEKEHADLPYILTTQEWGDVECAAHQNTPEGANAYLHYPFQPSELVDLVGAVTASSEPPTQTIQQASPFTYDLPIEPPPAPARTATGIELSEPTMAFPMREQEPEKVPEKIQEKRTNSVLRDLSKLEIQPEPEADTGPIFDTKTADTQARMEMPYLYESKPASPAMLGTFTQPLADVVVPGGATQSPDMETLKKYLLLREQDVGALSAQLQTSREQNLSLEDQVKRGRIEAGELEAKLKEQAKRLEALEGEKAMELEELRKESEDLRFQLKANQDKARVLERKVKDAATEVELIKERVKADIRKIRVREKELENRLELIKKDSEALISARETKIIELKRKLDLVEFNMDLLQEQYAREKTAAQELRERLSKASQAMRMAGGLLEEDKAKAS